ncbi:hypothetical protein KDX38_08405 [Pseudomonas sp. CDFA 602]|uniref:hypothetical protein n=1 Tax=Pseudomonas californiensis TaxID=2829823 RepID=UPI001E49E383|nr:hypothetical protein [Pseudomonas californiensis]MCD5993641.1 hypothetical protein [Pseudomonas californiensis]MCD5999236.1 hypothetical protein [Pseudomonas californiensis]
MGFLSTRSSSNAAGGNIPLGGYADVFASGDAFKAAGSMIQRSQYPQMSAAFPRRNAFTTSLVAQPLTGSSSLARCGTFGKGKFVIMMTSGPSNTSSDSLYSTDGITWTPALTTSNLLWNGICHGGPVGNTKFIAVGTAQGGSAASTCCVSADGITWTTSAMPSLIYQSVIWSDQLGLFVAFTNSTACATSPDGITWTQRATPAGGYYPAAGPNCVIAMNPGGNMIRTTDGVNFAQVPGLPNKAYSSVVYANNMFVATVGSSAAGFGIVTSPDGLVWTPRVTPSTYAGGQLAYGDGVFLCTGSSAYGSMTSTDAINWIQRPNGINGLVYSVFGNGVFLTTAPFQSNGTTYNQLTYTENSTTSDWMYIAGTAGKFVRVK